MSKLSNSIKDIYEQDISDQEAKFISNNLINFFKILEAVNTRLNNKQNNEGKHENYRSTN